MTVTNRKSGKKQKTVPTAPAIPPSPWRVLGLFSLAMTGLILSLFLAVSYLRLSDLPCTDEGCDLVRAWHDRHFPRGFIPVLGSIYFLTCAAVAMRTGHSSVAKSRTGANLALSLGAIGLLAVAALTIVEIRSIRAFCFWCGLVAIATIGYFILAVMERGCRSKSERAYDIDYEPYLKWGAVPLVIFFFGVTFLDPHPANTSADITASSNPGSSTGKSKSPSSVMNTPVPPSGQEIVIPPPVANFGLLSRPGRYSTGPGDAPVTVVEFADPACPHCATLIPVMKELQRRHPKDVRIVYRHFPLRSHADSKLACQAMEAARAQGKLDEYRALIYQNISAHKLDNLVDYARAVGLDLKRFEKELTEGKYLNLVQQDRLDGEKLAVRSTPTLFINGRQRYGVVAIDLLDRAIQAEKKRLAREKP